MEYPGAWAALPFGTHEERTPIPVRVKPFKSRPARSEQNEAVRRFAYGLTTAKERRYLRYRLKLAEERQQQEKDARSKDKVQTLKQAVARQTDLLNLLAGDPLPAHLQPANGPVARQGGAIAALAARQLAGQAALRGIPNAVRQALEERDRAKLESKTKAGGVGELAQTWYAKSHGGQRMSKELIAAARTRLREMYSGTGGRLSFTRDEFDAVIGDIESGVGGSS